MSADAPTPRVVVVDDHALVAETLELALTRQGFAAGRVEVPTSPTPVQSVVDAVLEQQPGVLLVDLDLGAWGDGFALIEPAVKAGVGVVALSDSEEPAELARAVMCGASKVLSKTEPLASVLDTVRRLLDGEPTMSDAERADLVAAWGRQRAGDEDTWSRFDQLTDREAEVLALLMRGRPARRIAELSGTAEATVRTQVRAVLTKLGVGSQLEAVGLAYGVGWVPPTGWREPPGDDTA